MLGDLAGGLVDDHRRNEIRADRQTAPPDHPILLGLEQIEAAECRAHDDRRPDAGRTGPRVDPSPASVHAARAAAIERCKESRRKFGDRRIFRLPTPARSRRPSLPGPEGTTSLSSAAWRRIPDRPSTRPRQVESISRPRQVTAACPTTKIRSGIPASHPATSEA